MKNFNRFLLLSIALCILLLCPFNSKAAAIKLKRSNVYLKTKQTYQLKMSGLSSSEFKKVTFESSNPSVVKVTRKGKLKAKKPGTVLITASYNNQYFTCNVYVNKDWSSYNGTYKKDFNKKLDGVEYYVLFKQSNNGSIKIQIEYFGVNYSPIYITDVIPVYLLGEKGTGSFQWTDTWENSGIGTIKLKNNKIIVNLKQTATAEVNRNTLEKGKVKLKKDTKKVKFYED